MKVEPHVARRVRDTTLKTTRQGFSEFYDKATSSFDTTFSPSKGVAKTSSMCYRDAKKRGIGIFRLMLVAKRVKQNAALLGFWFEENGKMIAAISRVRGFPVAEGTHLYDIEVSRHALERVSERLETIDAQTIRDELAAAIVGIAVTTGASENWAAGGMDGEYYSKTPHGIACIIIEGGLVCIPTWISNEMAREDQLGGEWVNMPSGDGLTVETVNGSDVWLLRPQ